MPSTERIFLYRFLPDEIRAFFLESGLSDVEQIAKTYGLSNEAMDALDTIQQEVLFGYEPVDKVRNLIQERLKFDEKLAGNVTLDLIEKRFLPIDSFLGAMAFRTYANFGGNPTVANIKRIDATGGTVADVRRRTADYQAQVALKVKESTPAVTVPSSEALEEVKEAVETTRAFDAALDAHDHPPAVMLDPSHELTAPVPSIPLPKPTTDAAAPSPAKETVVKIKPPAKKLSLPGIEEEAEVAKMMQQLQETGGQAPRSIEHTKIDEVQRRLSLTFPSPELEKRFRVVLGARLSGVRTAEAFQSALGRPINDGGLGFDAHTIDRIIEEVEGHKEVVDAKAKERQQQGKVAYVEKKRAVYGENNVGTGASPERGVETPATSDAVKQPKRSEATATLSKSSMAPAPTVGKRPVVDITYERRLVGPLEELKRMTIADFRRLPGTIPERIESIREDVDALRSQDPALRIQAIEAWRSSPLMRLYQHLLAVALQEGVPVERVLSDAARNPDRVQPEEIAAVRAFNRDLRF